MRKIELNPLIHPPSSDNDSLPTYMQVASEYLSCLTYEKTYVQQVDAELYFRKAKERLSNTILRMYHQTRRLDEFSLSLKNIIILAESQEYFEPWPSKVRESLRATVRNFQAASILNQEISPFTQGTLLSGSNAWGPFFAVRGDTQGRLELEGFIKDNDKKEPSDIDLLIATDSPREITSIVHQLIQKDYIPSEESNRAKAFEKLYGEEADMLSLRTLIGNVQASLHFIPTPILLNIVNTPYGHGKINVLRDLRSNIPGNVKRAGGYPLRDIKGLKEIMFHPKMKELKDPKTQTSLGYLTDNPTGGFLQVKNEQTYYMGVIPFFLLIAPAILHDPDNSLIKMHETLRDRIKLIMDQRPASNFPRKEEMPEYVIKRLQEYFA